MTSRMYSLRLTDHLLAHIIITLSYIFGFVNNVDSFMLSHPPSSNHNHHVQNSKQKPSSLFLTPFSKTILNTNAEFKSFGRKITFDLAPSISSINPTKWNACLSSSSSSSSSPFLEHSWIQCLEESNCASRENGWIPQHIIINVDGIPSAYIPMYVKLHSLGEFIFDNEWAKYAYDHNIPYFPKLLIGIPFTPVATSKILISPLFLESISHDNDERHHQDHDLSEHLTELRGVILRKILKFIATNNNMYSIHLNFLPNDEVMDIAGPIKEKNDNHEQQQQQQQQQQTITNRENGYITSSSSSTTSQRVKSIFGNIINKNKKDGFMRRISLQYHWINENRNNQKLPYQSFEEYLSLFKSKKRITIRRERTRVRQDQNIQINVIEGRNILNYPGLIERMFEIYKSTVDKMWYGKQYLNLDFFHRLCHSDFLDKLVFIVARDGNNCGSYSSEINADDIFAGTFNVVKDNVFYGRYWGCLPSRNVKNLHFEVCYWSAIEYCISKGIHKMEPGAGGGDYKWARGFDPVIINSAHYIHDTTLRKAVGEYLDYENTRNMALYELLIEESALGGNDRSGSS